MVDYRESLASVTLIVVGLGDDKVCVFFLFILWYVWGHFGMFANTVCLLSLVCCSVISLFVHVYPVSICGMFYLNWIT